MNGRGLWEEDVRLRSSEGGGGERLFTNLPFTMKLLQRRPSAVVAYVYRCLQHNQLSALVATRKSLASRLKSEAKGRRKGHGSEKCWSRLHAGVART